MKDLLRKWLGIEDLEKLLDGVVDSQRQLTIDMNHYHPEPEPASEGVPLWILEHIEKHGVPHESLEGVGVCRWECVWLPDGASWLMPTGRKNDEGGLILGGVRDDYPTKPEVGKTYWGLAVGLKAGTGSNGGPTKVLFGDDDIPWLFLHDNADDHNTLEKVPE